MVTIDIFSTRVIAGHVLTAEGRNGPRYIRTDGSGVTLRLIRIIRDLGIIIIIRY